MPPPPPPPPPPAVVDVPAPGTPRSAFISEEVALTLTHEVNVAVVVVVVVSSAVTGNALLVVVVVVTTVVELPRSVNPSTKGTGANYTTVCKCFFLVDDRCSSNTAAALTSFTCTCMRTRYWITLVRTHYHARAHTHSSVHPIASMQFRSFFSDTPTHTHKRAGSSDVCWWTCSPCLSCCCNVTPLATFTFTLLLLISLKLFAAVTTLLPHLQTSGSLLGLAFFAVLN